MDWRKFLTFMLALLAIVAIVGSILTANLPTGQRIAASIALVLHVIAYLVVAGVVWFAHLPAGFTPRKQRWSLWGATFIAGLTGVVLVIQWIYLTGMNKDLIEGLTIWWIVLLAIADVATAWANNSIT